MNLFKFTEENLFLFFEEQKHPQVILHFIRGFTFKFYFNVDLLPISGKVSVGKDKWPDRSRSVSWGVEYTDSVSAEG